jgi:hypothetical protein
MSSARAISLGVTSLDHPVNGTSVLLSPVSYEEQAEAMRQVVSAMRDRFPAAGL